jgi:hypothetical protein
MTPTEVNFYAPEGSGHIILEIHTDKKIALMTQKAREIHCY